MAEGEPPLFQKNVYHAMIQIPLAPAPTLTDPSQWSKEFNSFVSLWYLKNNFSCFYY
jgi:hypothetical protein